MRDFVARMRCVARMLAYHNAKLGKPLGSQELEDVAQEVIMAMWKKLADYAGRAPLESWAYRFCFLEVMSAVGKQSRKPRPLEDLAAGERNQALAQISADPLRFEHVYRGLEQLDSDVAEVIRLKHFDGLIFDEIAQLLELPVNTVKARYYRALPRLRELLGESVMPRSGEQAP